MILMVLAADIAETMNVGVIVKGQAVGYDGVDDSNHLCLFNHQAK